jgi:hypothetical protein
MLTSIVFLGFALFAAAILFGHVAALRTIFTSADHADGKQEGRLPKGWQPDIRF